MRLSLESEVEAANCPVELVGAVARIAGDVVGCGAIGLLASSIVCSAAGPVGSLCQ